MTSVLIAYGIIAAFFTGRYYLVAIDGYRRGIFTSREALITPITIGLCWPIYLAHRAIWP